LWAGLALGCVTPPSDERIEAELRHQAAQVQELGRRPHIVVCNAGSKMDVWGQLAESTADGPSTRARAMGRIFAKATRVRVGYVVGGPYPELVDQLLLDAFRSSGSAPLPGLVLLHVSRQPPQQDLVMEAKRRRVKLIHRLLYI
jgi:hypothetical protein